MLYFEKGSKVAIEYVMRGKTPTDILTFLKNQQHIPPPPQVQQPPPAAPAPQQSPSQQPSTNASIRPFKSSTPRHAFPKTNTRDHAAMFPAASPNIIQLTPQTFDSILASFPYVFVDIYYPGCDHCKRMAPIFAKAASSNTNGNVQYATFNGHLDESLLDRYLDSLFFSLSIVEVPALLLFKGRNNWTPFRGPASVAGLTNFVSNHAQTTKSGRSKGHKLSIIQRDTKREGNTSP